MQFGSWLVALELVGDTHHIMLDVAIYVYEIRTVCTIACNSKTIVLYNFF